MNTSPFSQDINQYMKSKDSDKNPASEVTPIVTALKDRLQSTSNYSMFNFFVSNREIDYSHVKKLASAITEKNLLHVNPILVNKSYQIIDGQHRLKAAEIANVPIFYIIDNSVSKEDIASMNSNKKNWSIMDYINYYTTEGNPAFVKFSSFCNSNNQYSPTTLLSICSSSVRRNYSDLKEGKIDISNMENASVLIKQLQDIATISPKIASSSRFIEAFTFISTTSDYDHERMIKKIAVNQSMFIPCINKKTYIQLLQSIYNRSVKQDQVVMFIKR